jgi:amidohydrolase
MHACGHDCHSTIALASALALADLSDHLPERLGWRVIFQPSEETGEGAMEMIHFGAMEQVSAIIALHVDPTLEVGRVGLRRGVLTADCQEIRVTVKGVGGHAARPYHLVDPIAAAAQLITQVYQLVPRLTDPQDAKVVSFTSVGGGDNYNTIPGEVSLRGTVRTFTRKMKQKVDEVVRDVARGLGIATGTSIDVEFLPVADAVVNDEKIDEIVRSRATEILGEEAIYDIEQPSFGGEDFSRYLTRSPGYMFRLGSRDPMSDACSFPLHSPFFDVDERALAIGTKLLVRSLVTLSGGRESAPI